MKKVFRVGETYWCVIYSKPRDDSKKAFMYWIGEGFLQPNAQAHLSAKLFLTKVEAENAAAQIVLLSPNLAGYIEVIEQVCPKDVWK